MWAWYTKGVLLWALALGTFGCALHRPLASDTASTLKGRWLAVATRPRAPFFPPKKPPANLFSYAYRLTSFGVSKQADAGDRLLRENSIVDPAQEITRTLSEQLVQRYSLRRA